MDINAELFIRGRMLVQGLRQEGRRDEADTVDALLLVAEQTASPLQYLTTGQVARRLGVTRQTIVNWVKQRRLPGLRVGGRLMIPATALQAFAQLEQLLDELDTEHAPLTPEESAALVRRGREGWAWQDGNN